MLIEIESESLTEMFTRIGECGVRAEVLAEKAADEALAYIDSEAPVGNIWLTSYSFHLRFAEAGHLQPLLCRFNTETNIEIIGNFLDIKIIAAQGINGNRTIEVRV